MSLTFVAIVHLILAFVLIVLVLLQDSKGGAMGMLGGGGGSNSVFGATGASNFLTKATKWVAIIFSATCIGLAYMTANTGSSVLDENPAAVQMPAPAIETAPAAEGSAQEPAPATDGSAQ